MFGVRQSGLLEFKLADIYQDADILKQASEAAGEILGLDPSLDLPKNKVLREKLASYMEYNLQNLGL